MSALAGLSMYDGPKRRPPIFAFISTLLLARSAAKPIWFRSSVEM